MEYQCKPFTMSILISAFSNGITQRIVVYSKKNVNPTKKEKEKQKDNILILVTFLYLQAIITLRQRVNKLIICTSRLTTACENCLLLLFMHTMLVSFVLVSIHVFTNKLLFCSSNCQMF